MVLSVAAMLTVTLGPAVSGGSVASYALATGSLDISASGDTAAAAAAGVIGGSMLMNSMRGLFGGNAPQPGSGSLAESGASKSPWSSDPSPSSSSGDLARDAGLNDVGKSDSGQRQSSYDQASYDQAQADADQDQDQDQDDDDNDGMDTDSDDFADFDDGDDYA